MSQRVLLKSEGNAESVSAWDRVYAVQNGFVLVDVEPYWKRGAASGDLRDVNADAAIDAAEICKQVGVVDVGGGLQMPTRLFRPATVAEVEQWKKLQEGVPATSAQSSDASAEVSDSTPADAESDLTPAKKK